MKHKHLLLLLGTLLCLFACSSSDGSAEATADSLTLTTKEITLTDAKSAVQNVNFSASGDWRVRSSESWCTPSQLQGRKSSTGITLTIEENTTTAERTATVTFQLIDNETITATLTVKQPGREIVDEGTAPDAVKSNATELVSKIGIGWNLGNTLESTTYSGWKGDGDLDIETAWGNPKTTKAMITAVKDAGFNAVRIPVRWCVHADDNLNINSAWMARVKEVVDYAYSQGMYVILNSHHDNWYDRLPSNYDATAIKTKFQNMWKQIATAFNDYDEHLILAGANEIIYLNADGSENWGTPSTAQLKFESELMQLFVNTVRATGGNNAWRCLAVQPWACNIDNAMGGKFTMPADSKTGRLILEFHNYTWNYSTETDTPYYFWGKAYSSYSPWYSNGESQMDELFNKVKTNFIQKGIPVIMSEFGCVQHNKSSNEAKCDASRGYYLNYVVEGAKAIDVPGFYWDNNCFDTKDENFGLLDRKTCTFPTRAKIALSGMMGKQN